MLNLRSSRSNRKKALCWLIFGFSCRVHGFGTSSMPPRVALSRTMRASTLLLDAEAGVDLPRRRGWKRALSKVLQRRRTQKPSDPSEALTSMRMMLLTESEAATATNTSTSFIVRDFEELSPLLITHPDMLLKEPSQLDVIESLVNDTAALVTRHATDQKDLLRVQKKTKEMGSLMVRLTRHWCQNLLFGLLHRWSVEAPKNLDVSVKPRGNILRYMLMGRFRGDAEVQFDRLVFGPIRLSSGIVQAKRMMLNLWSFTPDPLRHGLRRYPSQFDFHLKDCTFTQNDLFESSCIRNGLRDLLIRILGRVGVAPRQVKVNSIRILVSVIESM